MRAKSISTHQVFLVGALITGGLSLTLIPWIGVDNLAYTFLVYFLTTCVGGTITYHRLLSHRSFKPPEWFYNFGVLCGVWGIYGSPLSWVAIHRMHHKFADSALDPHSPNHLPWWDVQFFSSLHRPDLRFVPDLINRPFYCFLHRYYLRIHLLIIASLLILAPKFLFFGYLWPAFLTWNLASLVNFLCHIRGYRNFETKDTSTNIWWLGLLVFGEGWHNNHHANSKKFSFRENWWEFDLSEWIIRALIFCKKT